MVAVEPVRDAVFLAEPRTEPRPHLNRALDIETTFVRISQSDPVGLIFEVSTVPVLPCEQRPLHVLDTVTSAQSIAPISAGQSTACRDTREQWSDAEPGGRARRVATRGTEWVDAVGLCVSRGRWTRLGKDGAERPPAAKVSREARQLVAVGETYDVEITPKADERCG